MCTLFSGHIVADEGKDWGKVLFITGIHHEKDREIIGDKYKKLIAWETRRAFDLSEVVITHDSGMMRGMMLSDKVKVKGEFTTLIMSWLKDKTVASLFDLSIGLKNLTSLDLRNNQLTDVSGLKDLKNLTSLYLDI